MVANNQNEPGGSDYFKEGETLLLSVRCNLWCNKYLEISYRCVYAGKWD